MRLRNPRSSQRGVTLIELMVSTSLMAVVLGAAITGFLGQNKIISEMLSKRESQGGARDALLAVERIVRNAGYGVGPEVAFDFDWYDCGGTCDPTARDSSSGPDELVMMSRNPAYFAAPERALPNPVVDGPATRGNAWNVLAAGSGTVTLEMHGGDRVRRGQVIQVLCPGAYAYTYVTVADTTPAAGAVSGAPDELTPVDVPLTSHVNDDPYQQTDLLNMDGCFSAQLARAFVIDRFRFFVTVDGSDPQRPRPFLMLDRGMDTDGDGDIDADDLITVAPDVEDFQVAYLMRDQATIFGTAAGTHQPSVEPYFTAGSRFFRPSGARNPCSREIFAGQSGATDANDPVYLRSLALAPCRLTDPRRRDALVPGNIVGVRLTVVSRTARVKWDGPGGNVNITAKDVTPPFVENHDTTSLAPDGYIRRRITSTILLPNMSSRGVPLI